MLEIETYKKWHSVYCELGFKPILLFGNNANDRESSKKPIGYYKDNNGRETLANPKNNKQCYQHYLKGGWIGQYVPKDLIVLDIDQYKGESKQDFEDRFKQVRKILDRMSCAIAKTPNGFHVVFKNTGKIKTSTTAESNLINENDDSHMKITYRPVGFYIIPPPNEGRYWIEGKELGEIDLDSLPEELEPKKKTYLLKSQTSVDQETQPLISHQDGRISRLNKLLGQLYKLEAISGNKDLDLSYMGYLSIELKWGETEVLEAFEEVFHDYDESRTKKLYERCLEKNKDELKKGGSLVSELEDLKDDTNSDDVRKLATEASGIMKSIFKENLSKNIDNIIVKKRCPKRRLSEIGGGCVELFGRPYQFPIRGSVNLFHISPEWDGGRLM